MELVRDSYRERVSDIEAHFELLENISNAISNHGRAAFPTTEAHYTITTQQQRILFSSTYLQLYNLVESTVTQLMEAVGRHSQSDIDNDLSKLSNKIRDLYLKQMLPAKADLTPEKRLEHAISLLEQAIGSTEVTISIPRGGGGNWDYQKIHQLNKSIGVGLIVPDEMREKIERPFRNENGPLRHIKDVRNNLGHGNISFAECGAGHSHSEFRGLIDIVKEYLELLMDAYESYINDKGYLSTPNLS